MRNNQKTIYVGIDVSKDKLSETVADGSGREEVESLGIFTHTPSGVEKLLTKLSRSGRPMAVCYEVGPTGYGLYRQVRAFGFECQVVAPSLIPVRAGVRVKTDRLDAMRLARLFRAGELTAILVPDQTHEAIRDLVRARESAAGDQRHKRQLISAFLLRHGGVYPTRDAARQDVFDYIELFYNPKRKHTNNGMLSPVDFLAIGHKPPASSRPASTIFCDLFPIRACGTELML